MQQVAETGSTAGFRKELGLLDFTLLVVGAIIGDGIYVVGAIGARAMGPAQMVAWAAAGAMAVFIGLAFVQCAAIDHKVGGSYSYARMAFGPFLGFMAGWTLYIGEWTALAAFPTAFFNYFQSLTGAADGLELPVKVALITCVTLVNLAGVRQGARTNDVLTAAKLLPLAMLIALALAFLALHFRSATDHLTPFAPLGLGGFSGAMLPIFWAYAGFELAVLPAGEVRSPEKNLPRGLIIGVAVSTAFYLLISFSITIAMPWQDVAASSHPLASVMAAVVQSLGGPADLGSRLMSLGGLISIAGVFVVFTLGLARLSFALAEDGFFPSGFRRLHPGHRTPYVGILFQAGCSLVFSTLFGLGALLSTAVLFLSFCYLLTALSALKLSRLQPEKALHLPALPLLLGTAAVASLFLTAQASLTQLAIGFAAVLAGATIYMVHGRRWQRHAQPGGPSELPGHEPHVWLRHSMRRTSRP